MDLLSRLVDIDNRRSLSARLRRKRFILFQRLLGRLPRPVRILDVGGTESFWQTMGLQDPALAQVLLLNIHPVKTSLPNFRSVRGDARDLSPFGEGEFDVVFSNSVIEHVGDFDDQRRMADEVRRVGRRYFVQTPNYYFPVEPHFVCPLFQFLPEAARARLVQHFALGTYERLPERARALEAVREFRLLSLGELKRLFPGATIYKEKWLGLTKSFVAFEGWDAPLPGRA